MQWMNPVIWTRKRRAPGGPSDKHFWPNLYSVLLQTGPVVEQAVRGLVLVPTKELARQAQSMIHRLAAYCARDVRVANVSAAEDSASQRWVKAAGL
jgi:ATP-dependent RNA helicase DDX56/DBP9